VHRPEALPLRRLRLDGASDDRTERRPAPSPYSGTARGPSTAPVVFRVSTSGTVRNFKLSEATLNCGSFGHMTETFLGPTMRIRSNRFKGVRRYHPYRYIYAEVSVAGSFRGRRASGAIEVDAAPCLSSFRFSAVWRHR